MINHNLEDWIVEFDIPAAGGQPDPAMGGLSGGDLSQVGPDDPDNPNNDPSIANFPPDQMPDMSGEDEEDVTQDPEAPDMPETMTDQSEDFEIWKDNYFKESIKADPNELLDFMSRMRERDDLEPYQRKFIEDNWNIQLLRLHSNIADASKQIRKAIRNQLDKNNPATSTITHLTQVLDTMPHLNSVFIKMTGYTGQKGELHRKFLAALLGAVQVSSSPNKENIIFNDNEYSIKMPTRLNSEWGDLALGAWSLREDDPERYLSEPELKRLQDGSPAEREVLRRRVVVESIAKQFEELAFITHVVNDDGVIHCLGWDLSNALRGAYVEGKLVVRTKHSDNSEAMIDDNGAIIPMIDLEIHYVKETGQQGPDGKPETEELDFIERRNGMLFLTAGLQTLKDAATAMQGTEFKEIPYNGNPSDIETLRRCVYSAHDMLMRQC